MAIANKSEQVSAAILVTHVGSTAQPGKKIVDVGVSGDGQAIYITAIYGVATTAGVFDFYSSAAPSTTGITRGGSNHHMSLYVSLTGDGITGVKIGPISNDLYVCSNDVDTAACGAGMIHVDYEEVGTV